METLRISKVQIVYCTLFNFTTNLLSRPKFFVQCRLEKTLLSHYDFYLCFDVFSLQLERSPKPFPKLVIKRKVENIDDFKMEDFEIVGYKPYPKIKMEMSV
ncbi:hypothetical protein BSL78_06658 [Apostichopus japonicus]|uniref:Thymidylate synthase n=1 Tax=Stichopus japonicus TaxID=307972 RepID=A0A2G8L829_STIJA|nr:hypothetical protein BSL78_06658 [Apostichopus japonicus]